MDDRKKQIIAFISLLIVILIFSIGYFIWNLIFNYGTLEIKGITPFSVSTEKKDILCEEIPCTIKLNPGSYILNLKKEGFLDEKLSVSIKRWQTESEIIHFSEIPKISFSQSYPVKNIKSYILEIDSSSGKQILIDSADKFKRPLFFFDDKIESPLILSGKNHVLLIEQAKQKRAYFLDLNEKSRTKIDNIFPENIIGATLSENGRYLVFSTKDSDNYIIWDKDFGIRKCSLKIIEVIFDWNADNKLFLLTSKNPIDNITTGTGKYLAEYDPEKDLLIPVYYFANFPETPTEIVSTSNMKAIYVKTKDAYYLISM